jgi:ubiquinone/menaquinone biosynthesis C-methylase UbiE
MTTPPVCDYEGSDYQSSFWDRGGREYEDRVEAAALKRLLPQKGKLMLELGAGAGRNTPRYYGFERIVLLDYSTTQLQQAQERLGRSARYTYVAADAYRLPFADGLFDAATMIRALHHMADAPKALEQVRNALQPNGIFILEFANKRNLKAILRYLLGRQTWSPFTLAPVEFVVLNYDFHPKAIRNWLETLDFTVERTLTVSHFRIGWLKRIVPTGLLVLFDSLLQPTGALWQLTPSVFVRARKNGVAPHKPPQDVSLWFRCVACGHSPLTPHTDHVSCPSCQRRYAFRDGIYDFREPLQ